MTRGTMLVNPEAHGPEQLDSTDLAIIAKLRQDGHIAARKLAAGIGMSETPIRQRLNRLLAERVIHIADLVDRQALGRPLIAWFLIRTDADSTDVGRTLAALPEIRWLARCGDVDRLIAQTNCATNRQFLEIANTKVRSRRGVKSVETLIQLQTHVTEFRFPITGSAGGNADDVWVRGAAPSRSLMRPIK